MKILLSLKFVSFQSLNENSDDKDAEIEVDHAVLCVVDAVLFVK